MPDKSKLFEDLIGWPTITDFQQKRVFQPSIADEILFHLERWRYCVLTGPPRSGKTTLARLVGWNIKKRKFTAFKWVRYLDLADIDDTEKDIRLIPQICMQRGWLLIIDNWHACPDCHEELLKVIRSKFNTNFGILVAITKFASEDGEIGVPSLRLGNKQEEDSSPINTQYSLLDVARKMIDRYIEDYKARQGLAHLNDSKNVHFDEEDYEQALSISSAHKKIRGNLRFLSWRLKAWNLTDCHLRDVIVEKVLDEVKRQILNPHRSYLGTLEKIASLSQWEIPFRRSVGENAPDGIEHLEQSNLVVAIEPGSAWRMDSTDAYLFMLAISANDWENRTFELLKNYAETHINQITMIIHSVFVQAIGDTKTKLLILLLENRAILEQEKIFLHERLKRDRGKFYYIKDLVNVILRELPKDQEQAEKRFEIVATLLPEEVGRVVGESARYAHPFKIIMFLTHLCKDIERFKRFGISFLYGYGENALHSILQSIPSGKTQRRLLSLVKKFDSSLKDKLRSRLSLRPVPLGKRFLNYLYWLAEGSIDRGSKRYKKIKFIKDLNEDYLLEKLERKPRAVERIQFLIHSALWLSFEEASRLASFMPRIWSKLDVPHYDAGMLRFLLFNCWAVNNNASQELVDLLLDIPVHILIPPEKAAKLGRLIAILEKIQPGIIKGWFRDELDYLSNLMLSLENEEDIDDLIISLAVFAPEILVQLEETCSREARQRLLNNSPEYGLWPRYGVLTSINKLRKKISCQDLPDSIELASCETSKFIFALYGIQQNYPIAVVRNLFSLLPNAPRTHIPALWLIENKPIPWKARNVIEVLRKFFRININPRTSSLHNMILVAKMLSILEWNADQEFNYKKVGHKSLQTAIHENIIRLEPPGCSERVRAVLNEQNPFVQAVLKKIENVLKPIHDQTLSLTEWDNRLGINTTNAEIDYWRSKLLKAEAVRWMINTNVNPYEIKLYSVTELNRILLYELIDLSPPTP